MTNDAITRDEEFNKDLWKESYDPNFVTLSMQSRVTADWLSVSPILPSYVDAPIIPISNYVENIGVMPELVAINGNTVKLRQLAYADIFLLKEDGQDFYNVDRPWMRQYYMTRFNPPTPNDCFENTYIFFTTWMPTFSVEVTYTQPDVESPVHIYPKKDFWVAQDIKQLNFITPHMVAFNFKKVGAHMEDHEFGVIRRGMPLFDMTFQASDIIVEKIRKMYAND